MFNFGDSVDRNTVDNKSNEPATVNFRQTGDKSVIKSTVDFVADFGDCRLCRQCVPGLTLT